MSSGKLLQPLLLLAFLATAINAYVHSCEEVKYRLLNSQIDRNTTFACVYGQEGYNSWDQLKRVEFAGYSISLSDLAEQGGCISKRADEPAWRLISPNGVNLNCDQEFTVIYTSDVPSIQDAVYDVRQSRITNLQVFVQPRNLMYLHFEKCTGNGKVTVATGAGLGEKEERYDVISWPCSAVPDYVITFDNVITVYVDKGVTLTTQFSRNLGDPNKNPMSVENGDHIVLVTSGRADDLQNIKSRTDNRAYIQIGHWGDQGLPTTADMNISLDWENSGCVAIQKDWAGAVSNYYNGTHHDEWNFEYFELRYEPKGKDANEIWNSQDNVILDIQVGTKRQ